MLHPTTQTGAIAELLVAYRFAEAGRVVCWPLIACPYDLVVDGGDGLFRVQVKVGNRRAEENRYWVHLDKARKRKPLVSDFDYLAIVCETNAVYVIPSGALVASRDATGLLASICVYPQSERFSPYLNRFGLGRGEASPTALVRPSAQLTHTHWYTTQQEGQRKRHRRLSIAAVQAIRQLPVAFFKADEAPGRVQLRQVAQQFNVSTVTLRNLLRGKRKDLSACPPA